MHKMWARIAPQKVDHFYSRFWNDSNLAMGTNSIEILWFWDTFFWKNREFRTHFKDITNKLHTIESEKIKFAPEDGSPNNESLLPLHITTTFTFKL